VGSSFFFQLSPPPSRFSIVLDARGRVGGLGGKVGSACEELEDNEGGILG